MDCVLDIQYRTADAMKYDRIIVSLILILCWICSTSACDFACENGKKPQTDENFTPTSDGCGSYGVTVDFGVFDRLTPCCNDHDICYSTCGLTKDHCDAELEKCVHKTCEHLPDAGELTCELLTDAMKLVVESLGCPAYLEAQEDACLC